YSATNLVAQCARASSGPGRWPSATRTWLTDWNAWARSSRHVARVAGQLGRPPGRPSARALELRAAELRGGGSGGIGSARALDGPEGEAERESAHAGRRGLGASEARRARSARALDGPPDSIV